MNLGDLRAMLETADLDLVDPGDAKALPNSSCGIIYLETGGAETRTLAAPGKAGLFLCLTFKTDGGDCVVTCSTGLDTTGDNTITFADAGETIWLQSVWVGTNLRWRALSPMGTATDAEGPTLSTV